MLAVLMSANLMSLTALADETAADVQAVPETEEVTTENETITANGTNTEDEAVIQDDENTVNLYVTISPVFTTSVSSNSTSSLYIFISW